MAKGITHWLVCILSTLAIGSGPGNEAVIFPIFQICGGSLEPLIRAMIRLRSGIEKGWTFLWNRLSKYSRQSSGYMFVRKRYSYCPLFKTLMLNDCWNLLKHNLKYFLNFLILTTWHSTLNTIFRLHFIFN